jgi:hypothetical protein
MEMKDIDKEIEQEIAVWTITISVALILLFASALMVIWL